jgi:hypothetical protein
MSERTYFPRTHPACATRTARHPRSVLAHPMAILRIMAILALVMGATAGCAAQRSSALRVVAVENNGRRAILLVQVTNPERRSIRLQRLTYSFAGAGHSIRGEVELERDVAAGAVAIVEVPVHFDGTGPFVLEGNLTALLDRIIRVYPVNVSVPSEPVAP